MAKNVYETIKLLLFKDKYIDLNCKNNVDQIINCSIIGVSQNKDTYFDLSINASLFSYINITKSKCKNSYFIKVIKICFLRFNQLFWTRNGVY